MTILLRDLRRGVWLEPKNLVRIYSVHDLQHVIATLRRIENRVEDENLFAAGFVSYDAAPAFDSALKAHRHRSIPLVWFALFKNIETRFDFLPKQAKRLGSLTWTSTLPKPAYHRRIGVIKKLIGRGDTYQVNFSYRLRAPFKGNSRDLFSQLMLAQPSSYGAFIESRDFAVCSASPELFFELNGTRLLSCPMKGTIARGLTWEEDIAQSWSLKHSPKNRAENLMIVDMVRNDMGRLAQPGSVSVKNPFHVEKHPTLWQMTTQVECRTRSGVTDIFKALFPAASITGAPKIKTAEIIKDLEDTPRGLYTGAIGFIAPGRKAQFSVAIRTVMVDKKRNQAEYGTGGGIVWDSTAADERDESQLKTTLLSTRRPSLQLLETLLWTPKHGFFLLNDHLERLRKSADYFSFKWDRGRVKKSLQSVTRNFKLGFWKIRLLLDERGRIKSEAHMLPVRDPRNPIHLHLSPFPVDPLDTFLYHKTTNREVYEQALASCPGAEDVLLWNNRGEITESCVANVAIERNGKLYTPPVTCGLLAGTYRNRLVRSGTIQEKIIRLEDLKKSDKIHLINSVQKFMPARSIWHSVQRGTLFRRNFRQGY